MDPTTVTLSFLGALTITSAATQLYLTHRARKTRRLRAQQLKEKADHYRERIRADSLTITEPRKTGQPITTDNTATNTATIYGTTSGHSTPSSSNDCGPSSSSSSSSYDSGGSSSSCDSGGSY